MQMMVRVRPFTVPNFVLQEGSRPPDAVDTPKYALKDVPAETLAALCDQFRADVFKRANKADPAGKGTLLDAAKLVAKG